MVLYGILVALSAVIVGVYAVWNLTVRPPESQEPASPPRRQREPGGGAGGTGAARRTAAAGGCVQFRPSGPGQGERQHRHHHRGQLRCSQPEGGDDLHTRDTAVNRDWRKDPKINGAYAGAGVDVLKGGDRQTFGIPIDYYICNGPEGIRGPGGRAGGVDDYDDPYQDLHHHTGPAPPERSAGHGGGPLPPQQRRERLHRRGPGGDAAPGAGGYWRKWSPGTP